MSTGRIVPAFLVVMLSVSCGDSPAEPDSPPEIVGLQPNPVRAGEDLIISGRNLQSFESPLPTVILGGDDKIDAGRSLTPTPPASTTKLIVRIPLDIAPGNYPVRVRAGNREESVSRQLQVDIFTVTGTYIAGGVQISNTCDFSIGHLSGLEISFTDDRPSLVMQLGEFSQFIGGDLSQFTGTIDQFGNFDGQHTQMVNTDLIIGLTLSGRMQAGSGSVAGFIASLSMDFVGLGVLCGTTWALTGTRITTIPTDWSGVELGGQVH